MLTRIKTFIRKKYSRTKRPLSRYKIIKIIGSGATAEVFKTQHTRSKKFYTCKRFRKNRLYSAERESHIIKRLDSPLLPQYHKYFIYKNQAYLFTKYISGWDLFDEYVHHQRFPITDEETLKHIVWEMVECLGACELHNIQHLDIKLENFIVTQREPIKLKLIDFGCAHYVFDYKRTLFGCPVGTRDYLPPEVYKKRFHKTSDIWSLGVCAWTLYTGEKPFEYEEDDQPRGYIFPAERHMKHLKKMSHSLQDFFIAIFRKEPEVRIIFPDLIRHPWLSDE